MLRKISCLLPLCLLLALSSCGASPSAEQVLDQLEESIQQQDGALCFQLPAHSGDGWNILIYGRSESDGMGMSLHYLEEVDWQPQARRIFARALSQDEGKKAKIDPWKNRDIFCEKVERRKQDAENS